MCDESNGLLPPKLTRKTHARNSNTASNAHNYTLARDSRHVQHWQPFASTHLVVFAWFSFVFDIPHILSKQHSLVLCKHYRIGCGSMRFLLLLVMYASSIHISRRSHVFHPFQSLLLWKNLLILPPIFRNSSHSLHAHFPPLAKCARTAQYDIW